jgi:hypothetical protein
VVDETIYLEDTAAQILSFAPDPLLEGFHCLAPPRVSLAHSLPQPGQAGKDNHSHVTAGVRIYPPPLTGLTGSPQARNPVRSDSGGWSLPFRRR